MLLAIASPNAFATGGGKAFPTCRYAAVFLPTNSQPLGKPWTRAAIGTVRRGMPSKPCGGGSSAMLFPFTPSSSQAFLARVGPKSGPPCFFDPPTSVGAMASACSAHFAAPSQPFEDISSNRSWPTVKGCSRRVSGHWKYRAYGCFKATRMVRGRSWDTP